MRTAMCRRWGGSGRCFLATHAPVLPVVEFPAIPDALTYPRAHLARSGRSPGQGPGRPARSPGFRPGPGRRPRARPMGGCSGAVGAPGWVPCTLGMHRPGPRHAVWPKCTDDPATVDAPRRVPCTLVYTGANRLRTVTPRQSRAPAAGTRGEWPGDAASTRLAVARVRRLRWPVRLDRSTSLGPGRVPHAPAVPRADPPPPPTAAPRAGPPGRRRPRSDGHPSDHRSRRGPRLVAPRAGPRPRRVRTLRPG